MGNWTKITITCQIILANSMKMSEFLPEINSFIDNHFTKLKLEFTGEYRPKVYCFYNFPKMPERHFHQVLLPYGHIFFQTKELKQQLAGYIKKRHNAFSQLWKEVDHELIAVVLAHDAYLTIVDSETQTPDRVEAFRYMTFLKENSFTQYYPYSRLDDKITFAKDRIELGECIGGEFKNLYPH